SAARDDPLQAKIHIPESDTNGRDSGGRGGSRVESSVSALPPPPLVPRHRVASPRDSHRTPIAATFPRKRGPLVPARIGRAVLDRQAPPHRRAPPPDTARPAHRDPARDAAPSP